jgi:glycerate dehydrogenase
MKIAVLNESFLKDKHINRLKQLGEVVVYSKTDTEELLVERLKDVDVAIADCFEAPLNNPDTYSKIPTVKFITINSTGYDFVDVKAAKANNILIATVPGFSTEGTAEHNIALLLAAVRHIPMGDKAMRAAPFQIDPANKEHFKYLGVDIRGKVLGIVGLGQIGTRLAEIGMALGMKVLANNRSPKTMDGVEIVSIEDLLKRSDFVALNHSIPGDSREFMDEAKINLMKKTAFLINTAGIGVVNDEALANALSEKRIAGAGMDLIGKWTPDNPLLKLDNVVLTPHVGWFTEESLDNMADIVTGNIESFVSGNPVNVVEI